MSKGMTICCKRVMGIYRKFALTMTRINGRILLHTVEKKFYSPISFDKVIN